MGVTGITAALSMGLATETAVAVNNFGDTRSGGLAGPMALLVIVLLAVATALLVRNMNTRLRRLPDRFPGQTGEDDQTVQSSRQGNEQL